MLSVPRHVLIVEDNQSIRELLTLLLESEGYRVHATQRRGDALVLLAQSPPDLLVFGAGLQDERTWDVLRRLCQSGGPTLPVVVLSTVPQDAERALAAGATAFLPKPFDIDDLLDLAARFTQTSS